MEKMNIQFFASNDTGIEKRHMKAEYLDVITKEDGPTYELMGTGFTEANEEVGAQTDSKKYINDASATGSVKSYEWKKPFTADLIKSQPVIKFISEIGKLLKTGSDCNTTNVMVEFDNPIPAKENTFYARKIGVCVAVSTFNDNDGEIQVEGELLGIGDIIEGEFNTTTKTFMAKGDTPS